MLTAVSVRLISAITTLGIWERQWGSTELFYAHCKGVEVLAQQLKENNQHHLLSRLVSTKRLTGAEDLASALRSATEGFGRARSFAYLEDELMVSVSNCKRIESAKTKELKLQAIRSVVKGVLAFSIHNEISDIYCRAQFPDHSSDIRNLEIHILVQGAGVAMVNFLSGGDLGAVGIEHIDIPEMCREATEHAKHVATDRGYDELLLWAMFTMCALASDSATKGLSTICMVAERLGIHNWASLARLLDTFVFLDSATAAYRALWLCVSPVLKNKRPQIVIMP